MARYGVRQSCRLRTSIFVTAVFVLSLALWGRANCVFASDEIVVDQPQESLRTSLPIDPENEDHLSNLPLYLEVILNGQKMDIIAEFSRSADGRFASTRAELKELSIEPAGDGASDELIKLDEVAGISYEYDEELQRIDIRVDVASLKHNSYRALDDRPIVTDASTSLGGVINYGFYGSLQEDYLTQDDLIDGMSVSLEARVFGDFGVIETTGIIGMGDLETQRLESYWMKSFPEHLVTLQAGDLISGGLGWTRPLRMAGLQVRKNFGLRPDLITKPLPNVSGSAAVPSTVDVYVNNIRTYSKDVPSGPFTISELPIVSGAGVTRMVVRDASGRESVTETPFYSDAELLRPGIWDYSAEVGFPRVDYGSGADSYEGSPVGSGSLRYGFNDMLTVEAHAEGGLGVINGGVGVLKQLGLIGTLEVGGSVSAYDGDVGGQVHVGVRGEYKNFHFNARSQRTFDGFTDVGAKAYKYDPNRFQNSSALNLEPAKSIDFVTFGIPVSLTGGNLNLSYLHTERGNSEELSVASLSYSQKITDDLSMHSTGFRDFADDGNSGVYVGLSMSLGEQHSMALAVNSDDDGVGYSGTYTKTARREPGNFGWRLHAKGGDVAYVQGDVNYYGSKAYLRGSISQSDSGISGSYYADGAIAMTGDGVYFAPRIDDAFAIVDAGAPDVEVKLENRVVGNTGGDGKLLVTGLRAYQNNKITIDPNHLPLNANIENIHVDAVPAFRSGISVGFDIDAEPKAALVEFKKADGDFIEAGYGVKLLATGAEFVVGYDGQAYMDGLGAINNVEIELASGTCRASFPFSAVADEQLMISGVVCR